MCKLLPLALAVLWVCTAPLSAQIAAGAGEIAGITSTTPQIVLQFMNPQLRCAQTACNVTFERQTLAGAGGAAYDSRLGGLWVSNGLQLACINVTTCASFVPRRTSRCCPSPP